MKDLFTQKQINVRQGLDLVELQLGTHKIRLYYQTIFKMCSGIQGAIQFAIRYEGSKVTLWKELNKYDRKAITTPMHFEYRRSGHMSNVKDWAVSFEGSLIVLKFDELTAKMHYSDAAVLYSWLRRAGKQAKNWSGDRSRTWNTYAKLVDAEQNDKLSHG